MKKVRYCVGCGILMTVRHKIKYCSNRCQSQYNNQVWIDSWKKGYTDGGIGVTAKNISEHLKRYLHEKFEERCTQCGWNEKNPITGTSPLEIEHIDGNSENNKEENLTLLCPNCHALTPFYKNLNKGRGRKWRMEKYVKNS